MKELGEIQHKVNRDNRGSCNIDFYAHDCGIIWSKDKERPVFDLYYHVIEHASKLGEALRRELYDIAIHELGRTTIW